MGMTNAGRDLLASLLMGGAGSVFSEANARLGVGDSTTAFAAAQTDLQAATNKVRVAMDTGYPTLATNALTFKSTFGSAVGNFAWQEWGVFNAASAGVMFSRKVENLGTKVSGATWVLTTTVTLTTA